jgi:protein-tyrosine phosphatase
MLSKLFRLIAGGRSDHLVRAASTRTQFWRNNPSFPKKILFVCYGNICRSPYAEKRWNQMRLSYPNLAPAVSSGLHEKIGRETPRRFQSLARHLGVDLNEHRSGRVCAELIETVDLIFAMDAENLRLLTREFPMACHKMLLLGALGDEPPEIADPYDRPIGDGGEAYRRIDRELDRLTAILLRKQ